ERYLSFPGTTFFPVSTRVEFYVLLSHGEELWTDRDPASNQENLDGRFTFVTPRPGAAPHAAAFEGAEAVTHRPASGFDVSGWRAADVASADRTDGWQINPEAPSDVSSWNFLDDGRFRQGHGRYHPEQGWDDFVWTLSEATSSSLPLIKELVVPQAAFTPMPNPAPIFSFDFTFTPVQVLLETNPNMYSRPTSQFANLITSPQEVTVDLSTASTATNNAATPPTYTFAGELCLWELFEYYESDFPAAGIYVWNVAEVTGSSGTTSPSSMQYSTERFQVWVWIDRHGELLDIRVYPITGGTSPNYTIGTKRDNMTFTNVYSRTAGVDLEITKYVEGLYADLNTPFTFDLTLTGTGIPSSIVAVIYTYNDAAPPILTPTGRTVTITNGQTPQPGGFVLYHDDRLIIRNLPVGTTFNVTERAHATFFPEVEVFLAGTSVFESYAGFNTALSTGNRTMVTATGRNAADFTNNFTLTPPETGLFINSNTPLFVAVVLAAGVAVYITHRNRKKIEELSL
ncbi:MAG: DUF5979 domain-containing protein, partial [Coriobacteriia bacterium]|nr:DUF5979 domain-containing protein [Coriobacteriia bacterium]